MARKKKEAVPEKDVNGHDLLLIEGDDVTFRDIALITGLSVRALENLNPGKKEFRKGDYCRIS